MGNSRVTVREIARLAGVSVATVSRVSNGTGQVSEEMRRRVLEAIEEHGYRPDHLGRALAAGRHGALGLVFPGLSGPYFTELIQGFESEAVPARASVHILCTHLREDSDDQVLEMARRVDGIAVIGGTISESALLRLATMVPVVVLAGRGPDAVSSVSVDNAPAMTRLTRHLLVDHGLRHLAFVGNPDGSPDVSERWAGFREAYQELDLTPPAEPVRVAMQQPDGVLAAERLLVGRTAPQAVVCANDEIAIGVLVGALGRGLRVPDDLVITGFDDAPMAALVSPSLTTVRQPIRDLAAEAARQILNAAADPRAATPETIVLPTEFVVRRSCGCPAESPTGGTGK
ncbi:LacI family transcriptional regulator [Micromonospora luteifusca]|uniref:LacI family transcriptional regulator n=1 Tax=Micromonospora luteifusca TaxID=709860 RepID=A0ABS2LMY6_9ACTN|nr:LacI family DNA-binding transcriptional regulator [Micromonospora luteifusca]MBM7489557.1 LacI family transcriptional regulator [Micromonospora luteifusca]